MNKSTMRYLHLVLWVMAVHFCAAHSWASPPDLQTKVESMMVNLLQSDSDYDVALLKI